MAATDPNVQAVRQMPMWGKYIFDAFRGIQKQLQNLSTQTNGALDASTNSSPPQINAVNVTASGGVAHVQITDNNQNLYRGVQYHVRYSATPGFEAPVTYHMGPSRDARIPVGTSPLYYQAFSDYPTSGASAPVYHGGAQPSPVAATGTDQPPIPLGMGSGTGTPSQISGFGPIPWRGNSPPRRN